MTFDNLKIEKFSKEDAMKRIITIILFVIILMTSAAASAEMKKHVVVKGNTLGKIAVRYGVTVGELVAINKIKNKNLIRPGQILLIPKREASENKQEFQKQAIVKPAVNISSQMTVTAYSWNKPAIARCVDCQADTIVPLFTMPKEVKEKLIEEVRKVNYKSFNLKKGQRYEQMAFKKGKKIKIFGPVIQRWEPSESNERAYIYEAEWEGEMYYLVIPHVCNNWAWFKATTELSPGPFEEIPIEPELAEPPSNLFFPEFPEFPKATKKYRWDADFSLGFFSEKYEDGNEVSGGWGVLEIYPIITGSGNNEHAYGFNIETNDWVGTTGTDLHYDGLPKLTGGPAYRYRTDNSEFKLRGGYGFLSEKGYVNPPGSGGTYNYKQDTQIVSIYMSYEKWGDDAKSTFFNRVRPFFYGDLDVGHDKSDSFTDKNGTTTLNGAPENKSKAVLGFDFDIYATPKRQIALFGELSGTYYHCDDRLGNRAGLGVSFWQNSIKAQIYYTEWTKGPNSFGASLVVDLLSLPDHYRKSRSNGIKIPKEVNQSDKTQEIIDILSR